METIHLKTVDPISQDLLRAAEKKGIRLNWDRYEKLQPQDGFLRLGLSCPYGCLQGPCRIDPFGRGPDRGLCGLDRDGMTAGFLLRLALQGVLEILDGAPHGGTRKNSGMTTGALEKIGGAPVSIQDVYKGAAMLARPSSSFETILSQTLRLGLFALDRLFEEDSDLKNPGVRAGYGLLAGNPVAVGLCGKVSSEIAASLLEAATQQTEQDIKVVSLGEWIPAKDRYLPIACTTGEAELLLSTEKIGHLVAGTGTDPGILEACRRLGVPVTETGATLDPYSVFEAAQAYQSRHQQAAFSPDGSLVAEGEVNGTSDAIKDVLERLGDRKIALIGGSDMPHQPHGWIPAELGRALIGRDIRVAAWGDAAAWMIKDGFCSDTRETPVVILEPETGLLQTVAAMQKMGNLGNLAGVCFSGLKGCRDLSVALGVAAVGVRVNVAAPLPLWGSDALRALLVEKLSACGGELTHYDHPAGPEEILNWFEPQ